MGIKDDIQKQIKQAIANDIAKNQGISLTPKKSIGGFFKNLGQNITDVAKGLIGMGQQAITHPIEATKTIASTGFEIIKQIPKQIYATGKAISQPVKTAKEVASSYQFFRDMPYDEQKQVFQGFTEDALKEDSRGKRTLGALSSALMGATVQEATHPVSYAYEQPFSFALDALSLGQATGINKLVGGATKTALAKFPPTAKLQMALKEVFTPNGKLINAGFEDVAKDLTKTKSEIFKTQRQIIDDTATKFNKEFALKPAEQTEFFETIDKMRRTQPLTGEVEKAVSANPKIQIAIDWWLNEEAPKLAQQAGLPEEKVITNYLHHFFPEKFKPKEVSLKPLQLAKKGYLKKSEDVAGFTKDPVLSISAIKSKVAIDNLRDNFIKNTIANHEVKTADLSSKLADAGVDVSKLTPEGIIEKAKQIFELEEYKPKGTLRFYPVITETGGKVAAVSTRVETHLLPKTIVEELNKFTNPTKGTIDKLFMPFDIFNRNWKPLATSVRFRYHTRNIVGNLYNSIVVGGTNPKEFGVAVLAQVKNHISTQIKEGNILGKTYKAIFKEVPTPEIIKQAIDNDVVGRGFFGADLNDLVLAYDKGDDIMKVIKDIKNNAEIATPLKPVGLLFKNLKGTKWNVDVNLLGQWMKTMQKVGEFLEDNARLAMFQQGLKKFAGNADMAKDFVNKHLFDYLTGLGEADKYIKRLIPFWSWTRFNIPLQLGAIVKTPIRQLAIQKTFQPYAQVKESQDEGYQYLSDREKEAGYLKVGETKKGGKTYDTYIKTASVLPQQDVARLVHILTGKDEEIGITPLKQIWDLITTDPTKLKDYFGKPIEAFTKEEGKFLNLPIRGKTKALLSTVPALTELNKLIGGSYIKDEKPNLSVRLEQIISPTGLSLADKEANKFYRELEAQKEITGSYEAGLTSLYKKYLKIDMESKEKFAVDNIKILEKILKIKGLNDLDLVKLKGSAIKSFIKAKIKEAIK